MPVLVGLMVGAASAVPPLLALREVTREGSRMGMARLFASTLAPFLLLQSLLMALWFVWPDAVPGFGVAAALSFLIAVTAGVLRTWL